MSKEFYEKHKVKIRIIIIILIILLLLCMRIYDNHKQKQLELTNDIIEEYNGDNIDYEYTDLYVIQPGN